MKQIRKALTGLLFCTALATGPAQAERDTRLVEAYSALLGEIPAHHLSLEALTEHNEYDADKLVDWVKHNIRYNPTPGYQLSAEQSLHTASGNALEQALLLQNLLSQAGYETRLASAKLSESDSKALLQQTFNASDLMHWQPEPQAYVKFLGQLASALGLEASSLIASYHKSEQQQAWADSALYSEAQTVADNLHREVSARKLWQPQTSLAPWLGNASQYYFVKYRMMQGEPWLSAHPAFADSNPSIDTSEYFTDELSAHQHQIVLQAFIRRESGGKIETVPVTAPIKNSSSALFTQQISLSTAPANLSKINGPQDIELLYESDYFVPLINGRIAEGSRAFYLDGQDYSASRVLNPANELARSMGASAHQAGSALSSLSGEDSDTASTDQPVSTLKEYFVRITWHSPTGETREFERSIYRHHAGISKQQTVTRLSQRLALAAEPAVLTPAVRLNRQIDMHRSLQELLVEARRQQVSASQIKSRLANWTQSLKDLRFNSSLALSRQTPPNQQLISQGPMLALIWEQEDIGAAQPQTLRGFDYLLNAAQVIVQEQGEMRMDPEQTLRHGVWSTYSEALTIAGSQSREQPLDRSTLPQGEINAAGQFNQAIALNSAIDVVRTSAEVDALSQLDALGKQRLKATLGDSGNTLALVPRQRPDTGYAAYYKIDPETGTTLGYSEYGRGAASSEHAILVSKIVWTFVGAGMGVGACLGDDDSSDLKTFGCVSCVMLSAVVAIFTAPMADSMLIVNGAGAAGFACALF
jgi:hypothetical protein